MKTAVRTAILVVLLLCAALPLQAKDKAIGPWNIEWVFGATLVSNSNIYYEEANPTSDIVAHLLPSLKVEYEKLHNILFEMELELDSYIHFGNSDANITETRLHMQAKPVANGAYLIFAEDFEYARNFSYAGGLFKTGVNIIQLGAGYRGYHLDFSLKQKIETSSNSPGTFSDLDYNESQTEAEFEYLFEAFYIKGGLSFGSLDYSGAAFSDGSFNDIMFAIGKRFYPKNSIEATFRIRSQDHDGGDSFSGPLIALEHIHVSSSGRSRFHTVLEKTLKPSSTTTSSFTELTYVRFRSFFGLTRKFALEAEAEFAMDKMGSIDGQEIDLALKCRYTPLDVLPSKHITRKKKKPPKAKKASITINFGLITTIRTSSDAANEYDQSRIFGGIKMIY